MNHQGQTNQLLKLFRVIDKLTFENMSSLFLSSIGLQKQDCFCLMDIFSQFCSLESTHTNKLNIDALITINSLG